MRRQQSNKYHGKNNGSMAKFITIFFISTGALVLVLNMSVLSTKVVSSSALQRELPEEEKHLRTEQADDVLSEHPTFAPYEESKVQATASLDHASLKDSALNRESPERTAVPVANEAQQTEESRNVKRKQDINEHVEDGAAIENNVNQILAAESVVDDVSIQTDAPTLHERSQNANQDSSAEIYNSSELTASPKAPLAEVYEKNPFMKAIVLNQPVDYSTIDTLNVNNVVNKVEEEQIMYEVKQKDDIDQYMNDGIKPPYIISPPQTFNSFKSINDQAWENCLTGYDAPQKLIHEELDANAPPKIVHLIYVANLKKETHIVFNFMDYLMFRAAYFRLTPDAIYLHTNADPVDSPIWDMIRPMISRVLHMEEITEIYGNKVTGRAHFADIARLRILQQYGGMYLDIDVILLRNLPKKLWEAPRGMMMGYEGKELDHIGVGLLVARKDSSYLQRWLESYKTFDDTKWADHTVLMAGKLANEFPNEIDVAEETAFNRPSWRTHGAYFLWEEFPPDQTYLYQFKKTYAVHYWGTEARSRPIFRKLSASTTLKFNYGIFQVLRPILPSPYFTVQFECDSAETMEEKTKIKRKIESIVGQTFTLWEILVMDKSAEASCTQYIQDEIVSKHPRLQTTKPAIKFSYTEESAKASADGIWNLSLDNDLPIPLSSELDDALVRITDDSFLNNPKKNWRSSDDNPIEFCFDPNRFRGFQV